MPPRAGVGAYRPRVFDGVLAERLQSSWAVLLEGPKASGKTYTGEQASTSQLYLDVDALGP